MTYSLYRYFDASGALLYVGVTTRPRGRIQSHARESEWFSEAVTSTIEHFATREEMFRAEREAIWAEDPIQNKVRYASRRPKGKRPVLVEVEPPPEPGTDGWREEWSRNNRGRELNLNNELVCHWRLDRGVYHGRSEDPLDYLQPGLRLFEDEVAWLFNIRTREIFREAMTGEVQAASWKQQESWFAKFPLGEPKPRDPGTRGTEWWSSDDIRRVYIKHCQKTIREHGRFSYHDDEDWAAFSGALLIERGLRRPMSEAA